MARKILTLWQIDVNQEMEDLGVGEIVINSIDRYGQMSGYDIDLVKKIRDATSIPMTVLGGAGL